MTGSGPAVSVQGLGHSYGSRRALDGLDFEVARGERFALLGPNGGGKSTLFRILATLIAPGSGTATVEGASVTGEPHRVRASIGVVFQAPSLDPKLTVSENLWHQGHLYGLCGADLDARIAAGLAAGQLADRARDRVETLSGGLMRRVELQKALLHDPGVLLLDEPTTGLDPGARRDFWEWIDQLKAERGTTVLFTTHLLDEADRADRIVLLDQGRKVAAGSPGELKSALAGEVLTLVSTDPEGLSERLRTELSLSPRPIGRELRLEAADGTRLAADLLSRYGDRIQSLTLSKATLEDVFVHHTGRSLWDVGKAA